MVCMTDLTAPKMQAHFAAAGYDMSIDSVQKAMQRLRRSSGMAGRTGRPSISVGRYEAIAQAQHLALTLLCGPDGARQVVQRMAEIAGIGGGVQ